MGIKLKVLDPTENCPAASVAEHVLGDFTDFDTVRWASPGCYIIRLGPMAL
jgi:phosphoribosylaminoimidazole carboxylase (NCAIR synthetase)